MTNVIYRCKFLRNENILRKNLELFQQNCNLLHKVLIIKTDFIKSPLDIQTTCLETVSKSTPRQRASQDNKPPLTAKNCSIPSHVSHKKKTVISNCPVIYK